MPYFNMYDVALNCFGNEAMVTKKSESIVRSTGKVEIVGDTLLHFPLLLIVHFDAVAVHEPYNSM